LSKIVLRWEIFLRFS